MADRKSQLLGITRVSVTTSAKPNEGCKHAELISYKVHKDQFKSLLVPAQKGYGANFKMAKSGKNSGVQDFSKVCSDNHT